jgi:predicted dehydrogenase
MSKSPILKAALVGCGSVSQRGVLPHLSCADAKQRVNLVAVVDAVADRAQQSAEKFGVPHWFSSDEANHLLAARDKAGIKLVAAPGFDLFPTTLQMREVIQSGLIGKIGFGYTYAWGFGHEFEGVRSGDSALTNINPMWYYRKGAGPLPDVTIYSLQFATSILGPVVKVTALGNKMTPEVRPFGWTKKSRS